LLADESSIRLTLNEKDIPYAIDYGTSSEYLYFRKQPKYYELSIQTKSNLEPQYLNIESDNIIPGNLNSIILTGTGKSVQYYITTTSISVCDDKNSIRFFNLLPPATDIEIVNNNQSEKFSLNYSEISDIHYLKENTYRIYAIYDNTKLHFNFFPENGEIYTALIYSDSEENIFVTVLVDNPPGDHFITPLIETLPIPDIDTG